MKIIANRIKGLLHKLISKNQGGFITDKHISDNIILIQEAIHSSIERKEKGIIIKIGMDNAFNRVCHAFHFKVLQKFGFS